VGTSRIATLPTRLAQRMATRFPLRVVPCPVELPVFVERLQWHKYQERDPAIVWLRGLLREVAQGLPPFKPGPIARAKKKAGTTRYA
jgi:DNA-binding transcriptional LysR family regulator